MTRVRISGPAPHRAGRALRAYRRLRGPCQGDDCLPDVRVIAACARLSDECGRAGSMHRRSRMDLPEEGSMLRCRFHPQAWVNDYAIEVDPEGETDFCAPRPAGKALPGNDTYESDELREPGPAWARDWAGPFWVEILEEVTAALRVQARD